VCILVLCNIMDPPCLPGPTLNKETVICLNVYFILSFLTVLTNTRLDNLLILHHFKQFEEGGQLELHFALTCIRIWISQ